MNHTHTDLQADAATVGAGTSATTNATTTTAPRRPGLGAVVLAALALPGVWHDAQAEAAPQDGVIAFKFQHYQDSQPGLKRISVNAPSVYLLAPLSSAWAVEGSAVVDTVSGASPRWHTAISGASRMHDERKAGDVKLTHYGKRSAVSLGLSHSSENDYVSKALSLDARLSSEDNNTTWAFGVGLSSDTINPVNELVVNQHKRTRELMLGVTQAWTPRDLLQLTLTHSRGKGYFDDPYKTLDLRPDQRLQTALQARWNHALASGATLRSSWRAYHDSYGIQAHTVQAEWVQPLGGKLTLTPLLRYHTQSAANFYLDAVYDPQLGAPYPLGYDTANPPAYSSLDQRLSAFGALTAGLRADYALTPEWTVDGRLALYQQSSGWRLGGGGSPGLADFKATTVVLGASRKF